MNDFTDKIFNPWPVERIRERLLSGDTLLRLCQPRTTSRPSDRRESILEGLVRDVVSEEFGSTRVMVRRQIGNTLQLRDVPFLGKSLPDIVIQIDGAHHVCEVKSGRTDYARWDCVFDSLSFQEYLANTGHVGRDPWEVEQDLIKLHLFPTLSPEVRSTLFLMVDAYSGTGPSWSKTFSSVDVFRKTMRTKLVQGWAEELLERTAIRFIETDTIKANLIVCVVCPNPD